MAYQMQCSKCGVIGELDTPVAEFECPSCGGTMLPVDAAPTAAPAAKPAASGGGKKLIINKGGAAAGKKLVFNKGGAAKPVAKPMAKPA
ncbi:MAG: hypothetical protein IKM17_05975, partial [Lentisphaeria bacterium]|nr:hypothetical protein [Lentisphaeria bacterium]